MQKSSLWYRIQVYFGRLKKKLHPRAIRKEMKYASARASRHTYISTGLDAYIESLLALSEFPEQMQAMRVLEKGERSYLQVPLSEARFIETLVKSVNAKNALEIGTFRGFSTAFIARALPEGGVVLASDEDSRPVAAARRFWSSMEVEEKIHFQLGEARKTLARLVEDEPSLGFFDFVFIDADKENYRHYVEESLKLVRDGGLIVVDNTLWKGLVEYDNPHDNGAEHIRAFNSWVADTFGRDASLIPAWDGLTLIYKRGEAGSADPEAGTVTESTEEDEEDEVMDA